MRLIAGATAIRIRDCVVDVFVAWRRLIGDNRSLLNLICHSRVKLAKVICLVREWGLLCQLLPLAQVWVPCRWHHRRCIIITNLKAIRMRKSAVCFTTCDMLCSVDVLLSPFSFLSLSQRAAESLMYFFWRGGSLLDQCSSVCVYVGVLCSIGPGTLFVCVCVYEYIRMCQWRYEMCIRGLSSISLPGPHPVCVFIWLLFIPYPVCLTSLFCRRYHLTPPRFLVPWLLFPWNSILSP